MISMTHHRHRLGDLGARPVQRARHTQRTFIWEGIGSKCIGIGQSSGFAQVTLLPQGHYRPPTTCGSRSCVMRMRVRCEMVQADRWSRGLKVPLTCSGCCQKSPPSCPRWRASQSTLRSTKTLCVRICRTADPCRVATRRPARPPSALWWKGIGSGIAAAIGFADHS
jgi:hypothetical protein